MKYSSKDALLDDIGTAHDTLCARLAEVPEVRWCEPGVWGGEWTTYLGPNTASHYRFATKVLKRWRRGQA